MENAEAEGIVPHLALLAAVLIEEEDEEYEAMQMVVARLAAAELIELEEGVGLDEFIGDSWVPVTVLLDDYHQMGDPSFRLHFRMGRGVFEILCQTLHNHLVQQGRLRRERTPFQDIMLMVVWILATPDSFRSVALRFGVRPGTLHYFYSYVIEGLRELASTYITWPTAEERADIADTFQRASGFPGIIGCVDCTHVYITAPVQNAAQYINRHHSYSLNVQAIVDQHLLVRDLHVGEVGSMSDKRVFRRSPIRQKLVLGEGIGVDEHLVGDGGYQLTDYMMIPFPNNGHRTVQDLNFNRRLSQCRVRVENAFGRAKGKWRRIKFLHARNQAVVVDHVTASFVLHNFLLLNGEPMMNEGELAVPINNNQVIDNVPNEDEDEEEDALADQEAGAEARGAEKRVFIRDHILQDIEDEVEM